MLKKYLAPSVVVLCLTIVLVVFQNCGGGGGSLTSASQIDPRDLSSIEGEYFLAYDQSSLVYLKIDGHYFSMEIQQNNGGGQALYQENVGNITVVGQKEFNISYTKETCNPIGAEIVKIKTGTIEGTLEFVTANGKQYVFYNTSKYSLPGWVTSVSERDEDSSCSFEKYGESSSSYESDPYIVTTVEGYLDAQQPVFMLGNTSYQISQNSLTIISQAFQVAQQQGIQPVWVNGSMKFKARIAASLQSGYQQTGMNTLNVTQAVIHR